MCTHRCRWPILIKGNQKAETLTNVADCTPSLQLNKIKITFSFLIKVGHKTVSYMYENKIINEYPGQLFIKTCFL